MKFDYCIGNPPYQEQTIGDQKTYGAPIYDKFIDASASVAKKVELIHPARFLFNAGGTAKAWNQKILSDEHFQVLFYESDSMKIFPTANIGGGVTITYRDEEKIIGPIGTFITTDELRSIHNKVVNMSGFNTLQSFVGNRGEYRFNDKLHVEHPEAKDQRSKGHMYDISTNIMDISPQLFFDVEPQDGYEYIRMFGLSDGKRCDKYIRKDYVVDSKHRLSKYKVFLPKAYGTGIVDGKETYIIGQPVVGEVNMASTESFISIGEYDSYIEANNCLKYLKTRFCRVLIGILKVTQDCPARVFQPVPFQDFTSNSDIDWSQSIVDIDKQLYKKYNLSQDEIDFIETHVKEMQ